MNILEVNDLSKIFNLHILNNKRIEALKQINFTMKEGEIIGLTGKSGSGKSSLMKCIYRTYLATSGEIIYASRAGNIDMVKADDHQIIELRKTEITYCSQFLSVIPRVSAVDVVCENLFRIEKDKQRAGRDKSKEMPGKRPSACRSNCGMLSRLPSAAASSNESMLHAPS